MPLPSHRPCKVALAQTLIPIPEQMARSWHSPSGSPTPVGLLCFPTGPWAALSGQPAAQSQTGLASAPPRTHPWQPQCAWAGPGCPSSGPSPIPLPWNKRAGGEMDLQGTGRASGGAQKTPPRQRRAPGGWEQGAGPELRQTRWPRVPWWPALPPTGCWEPRFRSPHSLLGVPGHELRGQQPRLGSEAWQGRGTPGLRRSRPGANNITQVLGPALGSGARRRPPNLPAEGQFTTSPAPPPRQEPLPREGRADSVTAVGPSSAQPSSALGCSLSAPHLSCSCWRADSLPRAWGWTSSPVHPGLPTQGCG